MSEFAQLTSLLAEHGVPGVAVAIVEGGGARVRTHCAGVVSTTSERAVDADTVFQAASLSKPCFSLAVLCLVDAGELALDEPLSKYLPSAEAEPGMRRITAGHVLSHTCGLPNEASAEQPLRVWFPPGERFSYSGEGFVYLQRCVEHITREPLDLLMRRLVFDPLAMNRSSYVWREGFSVNHAAPHDAKLHAHVKARPIVANAAHSLHTTASDFALFLAEVLGGGLLEPATAELWLRPRVHVPKHAAECLQPEASPETNPHVAWGLGWGLEPEADLFFQWGADEGFRAFTIGSKRTRSAVVTLTNGEAGLRLAARVGALTFPGARPSFTWLKLDRPRKSQQ